MAIHRTLSAATPVPDLIVQVLEEAGITAVFGISGGHTTTRMWSFLNTVGTQLFGPQNSAPEDISENTRVVGHTPAEFACGLA